MLGARGTVQGGRVFADGAVDAAGHRHARQALLLHPLRLHVVHLSVHQTQSSSPVHIHTLCRPAVTLMYMREAHTMLEHQEAFKSMRHCTCRASTAALIGAILSSSFVRRADDCSLFGGIV